VPNATRWFAVVLAATLVAGASRTVHANFYLDPGSGSYVIQLFLSVLFALIFATKSLWRRALTLLRRSGSEKPRA